MNDDPVLILERELVDAARRRLVQGRPALPQPARRLAALTMLVPAAVAIAVVVIALLALRARPLAHHAARHPVTPASVVSSRRHLLDVVGVLSRPQTSTDLRVLRQSGLLREPDPILAGATVDIASARVAAIAPWGSRVLLALINPATPAQFDAFKRQFPEFPSARRSPVDEERITMWVDHGGGSGLDAAGVQDGELWSLNGAGRSFAGGSTASRLYVLVPDGVATVAFYSPPQSVQAGGPTYRHGLTVTVPVHGNIAAAEIHRQCCSGPLMIWYGADGRVIKRVGDFAAAEHAPAPPQPSPPTALSRRALRDPSTPNPVTAAPRTGGPHTTFDFSFRQLISDADYRFGFASAPGGRGCRPGRSTSNPDGGPDDVRGRIFTFRYDAPAGGWCPGTYRFSVALTDLGRAGGLPSGNASPFGTASFIVRR